MRNIRSLGPEKFDQRKNWLWNPPGRPGPVVKK
jgi:hypothetical protein